MLTQIFAIAVIALVYLCLAVIVFAPSIYVWWIYYVAGRVGGRSKRLLRTALTILVINLIVVYFLVHLGSNYVLSNRVARQDAAAVETVRDAVGAQERFFQKHGRYYAVGPVRGPHRDEYGLEVEDDLILQVVPRWNTDKNRPGFQAYALHVWGNKVALADEEGTVRQKKRDSREGERISRRLVLSVK